MITVEDVDKLDKLIDELEDSIVDNDPEKFEDYDPEAMFGIIKKIRTESSSLQTVIDKLREEKAELEDSSFENEERLTEIEKKFNAMTDRSNWKGATWSPILPFMERDPVDFIEKGRAL